jgi:hypothetical protein
MPRRRFLHHLLLNIFCLSSATTFAATFSATPIADALVSAANPANNYGAAGAFGISAAGLSKGEFQSLLRFDLAGAKASFDGTLGAGNWNLESVSLQLTATPPGNPLFNTSAAGQISASWMQNDAWTEGDGTPNAPGSSGVTWSSLPTFLSAGDQDLGTLDFNGATSGSETYALDLASGLVSDAATGGLFSIRLSAEQGDTMVSGLFNSRSFMNASSRPLLTLTAVAIPEPTSCLLVGLGAITVAAGTCAIRASHVAVHEN